MMLRGRKQMWACMLLMPLVLVGCATTSKEPQVIRDAILSQYQAVSSLKEKEATAAGDAIAAYEKTLKEHAQFTQPFQEYQDKLRDSLSAMEDPKGKATLSEDALLGLPGSYADRLLTVTEAHQGLGRLSLAQGRFPDAEQHAMAAIDIMKTRAHSPVFSSRNLIGSYDLLQEIHAKQGQVGKGMIAKLNADLLKDFLDSEGGKQEAVSEEDFFSGTASMKQMDAIQEFVKGVNKYREQEAHSTRMSVMSGLMAINAGYQQVAAQKVLLKSGGYYTPQVQQAQANAKQAMDSFQLFTKLASQQSNGLQSFEGSRVSAVLPSYSQQLVDPRISVNAPGIVKGFASQAYQAGGASYESGAQMVSQQVDMLSAYRQGGGAGSAVSQVGQFVQLFGGFMTQVQNITGSK